MAIYLRILCKKNLAFLTQLSKDPTAYTPNPTQLVTEISKNKWEAGTGRTTP
jgi:hypothetical protein